MPHPWRHSRPGWTGLWATWSSWRCPCSLQRCWARWPLKVPSSPKHSMILRSEQRPLPPCTGSAKVLYGAVLFPARFGRRWRCRSAVGMGPRSMIQGGWGQAGSPRGCQRAGTRAEGRHWPQFSAMPDTSRAAENTYDLSGGCSVRWLSQWKFKIFHSLFHADHWAACVLCWRGYVSQGRVDLGSSLTRSTPREQQEGSAKQGCGRGFALSRGTRLPLAPFLPLQRLPLPTDK